MHHVPLLVNIAMALGYALLGGLVARRLGLPTIVGVMAEAEDVFNQRLDWRSRHNVSLYGHITHAISNPGQLLTSSCHQLIFEVGTQATPCFGWSGHHAHNP
jgi:hypothetical protein